MSHNCPWLEAFIDTVFLDELGSLTEFTTHASTMYLSYTYFIIILTAPMAILKYIYGFIFVYK